MIIAISVRFEKDSEKTPFNKRYYVVSQFKQIFSEFGITLFPVLPGGDLAKIAQVCDGLILPGNYYDIDPKYYNQHKIEKTKLTKEDIFELDSKLIHEFTKQNKPIMGICGGMQALNIHFGGELFQDIKNHNLKNKEHEIMICDNSFLSEIYDEPEIFVNSLHHQAISILAPNFKVSAKSEDGIIEAIESGNIFGIQWHPELLNDRRIFEAFVAKMHKS